LAANSSNQRPSVGFAGIGLMGAPMAGRLAPDNELRVWNRTRDKADAFVAEHGGTAVAAPADLGQSDLVLLMLLDTPAVRRVLLDASDGLLQTDRRPRVVVNMSTIETPAAEEFREAAEQAGVAYVAAPVSGSTAFARDGQLTILASGEDQALDLAEPVLERLGRVVLRVGSGTEANLIKLCINLVIGATNAALLEALAMVAKGGVDEATYLEVLNESVISSAYIRYKTDQLIRHDFTPGHTLEGLDKDYRLMMATSEALAAPLPITSFVHQLIRAAVGHGDGKLDMTALLKQAYSAAGLGEP
jgi:3-hydroxyisobutyrate dehydrogenase